MSNAAPRETNPYEAPKPVPASVVVKPAEKPKKPPIPVWAWLFAVACAAIPFLTLGGAIPAAIGFGGAAGCVGLARDSAKPLALRVAGCVGITLVCYAILGALLAAAIAARSA